MDMLTYWQVVSAVVVGYTLARLGWECGAGLVELATLLLQARRDKA
jgi:hypothetical protein